MSQPRKVTMIVSATRLGLWCIAVVILVLTWRSFHQLGFSIPMLVLLSLLALLALTWSSFHRLVSAILAAVLLTLLAIAAMMNG